MKATGCFLLLCGWLIVLAALLLLGRAGQRLSFVSAGIGIEIAGWALLAQAYRAAQRVALEADPKREAEA